MRRGPNHIRAANQSANRKMNIAGERFAIPRNDVVALLFEFTGSADEVGWVMALYLVAGQSEREAKFRYREVVAWRTFVTNYQVQGMTIGDQQMCGNSNERRAAIKF